MRQLTMMPCFLLATGAMAHPLSDLAWLEGRWCRTTDDGVVEERWLPASENMMLAVNQSLRDGHTTAFEFLRIEKSEDGAIDYLAQPGGRSPTAFRMHELRSAYARFDNPEHDFPQTIVYERNADRLVATISGPDGEGGSLEIPFAFEACNE